MAGIHAGGHNFTFDIDQLCHLRRNFPKYESFSDLPNHLAV